MRPVRLDHQSVRKHQKMFEYVWISFRVLWKTKLYIKGRLGFLKKTNVSEKVVAKPTS